MSKLILLLDSANQLICTCCVVTVAVCLNFLESKMHLLQVRRQPWC